MPKLQEKPSALKREDSAHQNIKIIYFFYYCRSFLPSWIRIRFRILNADLDPATQINADPPHPAWNFFVGPCQCFGSGFDWIRIQLGLWIRIRFHAGKNGWHTRKKSWNISNVGCSFLRAGGFCSLEDLRWDIRINMLLYIFKKWILFQLKMYKCLVVENMGLGPDPKLMILILNTVPYFLPCLFYPVCICIFSDKYVFHH